jgi:ATP-dependent protease Clp ATPase subunit
MEAILLDSMFDLPSLDEIVISQQVVEGTAAPLYTYAGGARAL